MERLQTYGIGIWFTMIIACSASLTQNDTSHDGAVANGDATCTGDSPKHASGLSVLQNSQAQLRAPAVLRDSGNVAEKCKRETKQTCRPPTGSGHPFLTDDGCMVARGAIECNENKKCACQTGYCLQSSVVEFHGIMPLFNFNVCTPKSSTIVYATVGEETGVCKFPFKYGLMKFEACTTFLASKLWCCTDTDCKQWGYCDLHANNPPPPPPAPRPGPAPTPPPVTPSPTPSPKPSPTQVPYVKLHYGASSCPRGTDVTTLTDCEDAVQQLGITGLGDPFVRTHYSIPKWCSVRETGSDPRVHFGGQFSGGQGRSDLAPICFAQTPSPSPTPSPKPSPTQGCGTSICPSGQYLSGSCHCFTCSNSNCPSGQYRGGSCSGTTNGYSCKTCGNRICPSGQYRGGSCFGTTNGYSCKTCGNRNCPSGQYRSGSCSGITNGYSCNTCGNRNCFFGQYRSGSCSGTTNGYSCNTCSNQNCPSGQYRSGSCSGTTNGYFCEAPPLCDESSWPDKDHGLICGECKVLVDRFSERYRNCNDYCATVSRSCTGAWEEDYDTCDVLHVMTCDQALDSSDAICECMG